MYLPRLKDLRIDRDLKQTSIARLLDISQQHYSQYERGERKLPISLLIKLCVFYNVSADYILGLSNKKDRI